MDLLGIAGIAAKVIDKFIPDPQAKADALFKLKELEQAGELAELAAETQLATGQLEINKIEAGSSSLFVAGWRPACGWVAALALLYASIIEPFARFIAKVGFNYIGEFPVIDTNITMQLLFGLLGLGAMRSYDKQKGTSK